MFQFQHQRIVLADHLHDVLVVDYAAGGNQMGVVAAFVGLDKVAGHRKLLAQFLDLLRRLDAGGQIVLTERGEVEQLVFAFETGQLVLLDAEVGLQKFQAFVDIVVCVGDDALFVLDGILVIDADHLVDHLCGADRRRILQHDVYNRVVVVVAVHREGGAVAVGGGVEALVGHRDGVAVASFGQEPGVVHHHPPERHGHCVAVGRCDGLIVFAHAQVRLLVVNRGGDQRHIILVVVVDEINR